MHSNGITQTSRKEYQAPTHTFSNGVQVCGVANLRGRIISINGNMITVMPEHNQLKEAMSFEASKLQKCFKQGDHIYIILFVTRNIVISFITNACIKNEMNI